MIRCKAEAIFLGLILMLSVGCASKPYQVCRGDKYCTPPMTHEEALRASNLKVAWEDETLYVRPVQQ